MRVVQTVFGAFHHFNLARELAARGYLERIFSTWPNLRLKREGIAPGLLQTFPWIHTPDYLLSRHNLMPHWLGEHLGYLNAIAFDEYTMSRIPACDALIALSGSSLKTGKLVQQRGGRFICDRGSSHQRYQADLLQEEYARWGLEAERSDDRDTVREEEIYAVADAVTVPSRFAARSFVEMGIPASRVHVIPYGVELSQFKKVAEPSPDRFEVIFAGQVSLRKGIGYLLNAFADLKVKRKRLRVVGAVDPRIHSILTRLPQQNVEWLGSVPQQELVQLFSTSHVMVLPSVEEGLALVQGQALACGCPVIGTFNSGAEDLFTSGVEGFIVPIRDQYSITERLQQLVDDPVLQAAMSVAARRRVQQLQGWHTYGDRWTSLLNHLVSPN